LQSASHPESRDRIEGEDRIIFSRRLGPEAERRLTEDEVAGEAFLVAGVAAVLSRILQRSTVQIATGSGVQQLGVEQSQPFSALVDSTSGNSHAAEADAADASADLGADIPSGDFPAFHARAEASADPASGTRHSMISVATRRGGDEAQTERLLHYLSNVLDSAARDDSQPVGTLPLADETETLELYASLNATEVSYPVKPVQQWIAEQIRFTPNANAVVFEGASLTYRELGERSDRLATVLAGMGASQTRPVALCIPRSEQLPVVLLATLEAGSFFVPLDPSHPKQRLVDILSECKPAVVVVTTATAQVLAGSMLPLFLLDGQAESSGYTEALAGPSTSETLDDTAYTIYTSGTTGKPKGVVIPQRALVNVLAAAQREPGLRAEDRWLSVATISFDISILDMFLPLVTGATVVIASAQQVTDPSRLASLIEKERITCLQATPATWRMLLANGWQGVAGLRMLCGGEALPRDLANALLKACASQGAEGELWNSYGPTETTIYSSFLRIYPGEGPVPIGGPTANTMFYLADEKGRLLPPDVAGELYIGGAGVAKGYFERPELNDQKFVVNPWIKHSQQKMFRTGDAARFRPDGTLDFYGRLDSQVKLRGYRIELGEIESVLRTHPSVADAAVVLREDTPGEPWLVAYIVANTTSFYPSEAERAQALRSHAANTLPSYMLPSRFVSVQALPLTGSGKVDKRALQQLPKPEEIQRVSADGDIPVDIVEGSLLKIFREVLRSRSFGPEDSFFDFGGYSLLAVRLFARIAKEMGTDLAITTLFEAPTVRKLALLMRKGDSLPTLVPIRTSGDDDPFFLVHSYLLYGLAGSMVPAQHPVYGLREAKAAGQAGGLSDQATMCVKAIERVHPHGVVHLGGWCAAAPLTIEIARRLQEQGRTIGMVALFDADAPGFVPQANGSHPRLTRLRATLGYHRNRMLRLHWRGRFQYVVERGSQHLLQMAEWFYMGHRQLLKRTQRVLPFLPSILFHNRWTQIAVVEQQVLKPIDARIFLFRALDVIMMPGSEAELGWRAIARRGVEVIFVPGHHESMFHEPQFTVLRQQFAQAIQKALDVDKRSEARTQAS
jgi:amino acid adenylation domain-containing protein